MNNTLLKTQTELPVNISKILTLVVQTSTERKIPVFMIGAMARELILQYIYQVKIKRATQDIDFGVAVGSWDEYRKLKESLLKNQEFKTDKKLSIVLTGNPGQIE